MIILFYIILFTNLSGRWCLIIWNLLCFWEVYYLCVLCLRSQFHSRDSCTTFTFAHLPLIAQTRDSESSLIRRPDKKKQRWTRHTVVLVYLLSWILVAGGQGRMVYTSGCGMERRVGEGRTRRSQKAQISHDNKKGTKSNFKTSKKHLEDGGIL